MAGRQMASDSFTSNLAGMSKNQLYDIMSQMKILIEQNQQQARQILVENPALTKALFQAQIMLGMVLPPQAMPAVQQAPSQTRQQSVQPGKQSIQTQSLPVQVGQQDQGSAAQVQMPARKQLPNLPVPPIPSSSVPPVTHQSQTIPSQSLQSIQQGKGHTNTQGTSMALPQPSQVHTMPLHPLHSAQQTPSFHQSQVPTAPSQSQQALHSSGAPHHPLQPPLPPQPRPPSMQQFQHQYQQQQYQQQQHAQMGPHGGFQTSGTSQPHLSQPPYNAGIRHPANIGFSQGLPPLANQPPGQPMYQVGGSHLGADFSNQGGGSMQVDRASWMPGPPEHSTGGAQLPGPPPLPGHMGLTNQPPRPSQLMPDMEKVLLQQVMSLTPEQISLLPPEQRNQVFHLQQIWR